MRAFIIVNFHEGIEAILLLELLKDTDKTIAAITFDAGFGSESAFYRHFKNFTGQTPKQYRRDLHLQVST